MHQYWGAQVTLTEAPPWTKFAPDPGTTANIGTFRSEPLPIPEVVKKEWRTLRTLRAPAGQLTGAAVGLAGERVVTFSREKGDFYVFNLANGRLEQTRALDGYAPGEPLSYTFLREVEETDRMAIARPNGAFVIYLKQTELLRLPNAAKGTNVEPAAPFGLYGIDDFGQPGGGTLYFQWATKELAATVECQKATSAWSLSDDGKVLGLLYPDERIVELLDLEQRRILAEVETPEEPTSLAVAPRGDVLAIGGKSLLLFDLARGAVLITDTSFEQPITRVRFSPQADLLLVATADGTARSYALPKDLTTVTVLPKPQVLRHGKQPLVDVRMSADARRLVTTGTDREIHVWAR